VIPTLLLTSCARRIAILNNRSEASDESARDTGGDGSTRTQGNDAGTPVARHGATVGSQQAQAGSAPMRMRTRGVKAPPPPVSPPQPLGKLAALVMHALQGDADPDLQAEEQPSPQELAAGLFHNDEVLTQAHLSPNP